MRWLRWWIKWLSTIVRITAARHGEDRIAPASSDQGLVTSVASVIAFLAAATLRSNKSRTSARVFNFGGV